MLFIAFLNGFFFCIRKAPVHNFADDNTLPSFVKSVASGSTNDITLLVEVLMTWFLKTKPKQFLIENDVVEVASLVKLVGIYIDDQLSFILHISNIFKSVSK